MSYVFVFVSASAFL